MYASRVDTPLARVAVWRGVVGGHAYGSHGLSASRLQAMDQSVEQRSELESQAVTAARAEADALRAELQQAQLGKDAAVSEARDLSVEIKLLNANVTAAEVCASVSRVLT